MSFLNLFKRCFLGIMACLLVLGCNMEDHKKSHTVPSEKNVEKNRTPENHRNVSPAERTNGTRTNLNPG